MNTMHPTRRDLLAAMATAAPALGARPALAAQFYIWTQHFQSRKMTLAEGVAEALAATRRAGYRRVELMSPFFQGAVREKTLAALRQHRLEVPIVYSGGPMHQPALAEKSIADTLQLADTVKGAGARIINFNPSPKPKRERKSDEELDTQARYVNQLAAELDQRGMRLHLHHHDPEMAENAREWRHLLASTNPKLVSLCLDVHWVYRGQQDPMRLLEESGARLGSLHLRNSKQGVWTEAFEDGDIDYSKVAAYLKRTRFAGALVVELAYEKNTAITRSLEEDLRRSRVFAQKVFGVRS
jgi:inosose dehydratase